MDEAQQKKNHSLTGYRYANGYHGAANKLQHHMGAFFVENLDKKNRYALPTLLNTY